MAAITAKGKTPKSKELDIKTAHVKIVGDSPLITHRFVDRRKGVPVDVRLKELTPVEEFSSGIYWITNDTKFPGSTQAAAEAQNAKTMDDFLLACSKGARFGFPAVVIKDAAVEAARILGIVTEKVSARSLFFIRDEGLSDGLVEIRAEAPTMREDLIKLPSGELFSRYRPLFNPWCCKFDIEYNAGGSVPLDRIFEMINCAGYTLGIGDWRKARGGTYGAFHIEH